MQFIKILDLKCELRSSKRSRVTVPLWLKAWVHMEMIRDINFIICLCLEAYRRNIYKIRIMKSIQLVTGQLSHPLQPTSTSARVLQNPWLAKTSNRSCLKFILAAPTPTPPTSTQPTAQNPGPSIPANRRSSSSHFSLSR